MKKIVACVGLLLAASVCFGQVGTEGNFRSRTERSFTGGTCTITNTSAYGVRISSIRVIFPTAKTYTITVRVKLGTNAYVIEKTDNVVATVHWKYAPTELWLKPNDLIRLTLNINDTGKVIVTYTE